MNVRIYFYMSLCMYIDICTVLKLYVCVLYVCMNEYYVLIFGTQVTRCR